MAAWILKYPRRTTLATLQQEENKIKVILYHTTLFKVRAFKIWQTELELSILQTTK